MSGEVVVFVLAAVAAGVLSIGGVAFVYFLDQWRADGPGPGSATDEERAPSPFDRAA